MDRLAGAGLRLEEVEKRQREVAEEIARDHRASLKNFRLSPLENGDVRLCSTARLGLLWIKILADITIKDEKLVPAITVSPNNSLIKRVAEEIVRKSLLERHDSSIIRHRVK